MERRQYRVYGVGGNELTNVLTNVNIRNWTMRGRNPVVRQYCEHICYMV